MKMECALAEIIYIGLVAEKGRCYGTRWTRKYKKILKLHSLELRKIIYLFLDASKIDDVLEEFGEICEKEYEIGKFYANIDWRSDVTWLCSEESHPKVIRLMIILLNEVCLELNKLFVNKKKVYILLNSLHNLPRVFFDKNEETICNVRHDTISEDDAFRYVYTYLKQIKIDKIDFDEHLA